MSWARAAAWYERELDVDELAERLYQWLIAGARVSARPTERLAVHERCRRALVGGPRLGSSIETERLRRRLLAGTAPEPDTPA